MKSKWNILKRRTKIPALVLDKYLKSRKGRMLSLDEIDHVSAIADSLAFTIDQMARIDTAYQAAFPDRG
jgi:hypothetical protein